MPKTLPNWYAEVNNEYTKLAVDDYYQNGNTYLMKKKQHFNNIEALRKNKGMTRLQLADKMGTTETTVYRKERGDRKLNDREIVTFAKALGCMPEEIVLSGGESLIERVEKLEKKVIILENATTELQLNVARMRKRKSSQTEINSDA